ncbi:hypothetical protein PAAG_12077 [Paracoccidioides lutzii Pb01]|uniref:Uncharacterized protein n=1 Tax=Paracoccidioides lutzii (strain ATCC MYA-826 / Pb01) TaxID=502779 RepID=A0A0A2VK18_PARBA|nr:hypothetical protein PAAG_12077 [Paracoccidioides lutzii Pb01]KGQ01219.1 hypothetical protein PAAG_12077 [Paracoccidioides lutzii Pb01]
MAMNLGGLLIPSRDQHRTYESVHAITMVAFTQSVSSDDTFFPTLALFNELPGGGGRHVTIFDQYRHDLIATVFTATTNPNDRRGGGRGACNSTPSERKRSG